MIEKIGAVYLIKFYGGEGRKYPEVPMLKYLILPMGPSTKMWDRIIIKFIFYKYFS